MAHLNECHELIEMVRQSHLNFSNEGFLTMFSKLKEAMDEVEGEDDDDDDEEYDDDSS